jgi:hypothetical protein
MLSDLLLRLIVWLGWLFLRPFYSGKETKAGGVFQGSSLFFFVFTVQLGFQVNFVVGYAMSFDAMGGFGFLPSVSL